MVGIDSNRNYEEASTIESGGDDSSLSGAAYQEQYQSQGQYPDYTDSLDYQYSQDYPLYKDYMQNRNPV